MPFGHINPEEGLRSHRHGQVDNHHANLPQLEAPAASFVLLIVEMVILPWERKIAIFAHLKQGPEGARVQAKAFAGRFGKA